MKRSALTTTMGMLGAAFALVGCGKIDGSEFEGSTPTKDTVALVVPAASSTTATTGALSSGAVTVKQSALLGETAEGLRADGDASRTWSTRPPGPCSAWSRRSPTTRRPSVDGDTAVWGPYTDPLSANT